MISVSEKENKKALGHKHCSLASLLVRVWFLNRLNIKREN